MYQRRRSFAHCVKSTLFYTSPCTANYENSQTILNRLLVIANIVKSNHRTLHAGTQAVEFDFIYSDYIKLADDLESL